MTEIDLQELALQDFGLICYLNNLKDIEPLCRKTIPFKIIRHEKLYRKLSATTNS